MQKYDIKKPLRVMTSSGTFADLDEKLIIARQKIESPEKISKWIKELREWEKECRDHKALEARKQKAVIGNPEHAQEKSVIGNVVNRVVGMFSKE